MPGSHFESLTQFTLFGLAVSTYPASVTMLGGCLMNKVRRCTVSAAGKLGLYVGSYLVFFFLNLPMFLMWTMAEDPFPFYFFGIVTPLLFGVACLGPPAGWKRALVPAVVAYAMMIWCFGRDYDKQRIRIEERKRARETTEKEYREAMAVLTKPESFVYPSGWKNDGIRFDSADVESGIAGIKRIPVLKGFEYKPMAATKHGGGKEFFHLVFREREGEREFCMVMQKAYGETKHVGREGRKEVPFFQGSVFEHFKSVREVYFNSTYMASTFLFGGYLSGSPHIPSDRNEFDKGERVVLYDDTVIASSFQGRISKTAPPGRENVEYNIVFAEFMVGGVPLQCILAVRKDKPGPDQETLLRWIAEFLTLNGVRKATN